MASVVPCSEMGVIGEEVVNQARKGAGRDGKRCEFDAGAATEGRPYSSFRGTVVRAVGAALRGHPCVELSARGVDRGES